MLSLTSFHLFFIFAAIVLAGGFGTWCLMHGFFAVGIVALATAVLLVAYETYFAVKSQRSRLT